MRRIISIFFLFLCGSVNAADYYWTNYSGISAASPFLACHQSYTSQVNDLTSQGKIVADGSSSVRITMQSSTRALCYWATTYKNSPGGSDQPLSVNGSVFDRLGDSCASGLTYNSQTGACETPAGEDGTLCGNTTWQSTVPYVWSSGECIRVYDSPPAVMCKAFSSRDGGSVSQLSIHLDTPEKGPINGQTVAYPNIGCSVSVKSSQCTVNADGQGSVCVVDGVYTGGVGGGTDNPKDQDCHALGGCEAPDLTPKTDTNNQPCNYSTGADGSQSCTSKQETKTSGSQNCGTANGVFSCDWKSPTSKGIDIATNISTTTNADGSTTSVKTDVSTKTVCTDMNVCSSSTTTTKTTTTKDGTGVVTSTQSTCSGAACGTGSASNGSGTGSGGTGEGEGGGDCVTAEECSDGSSPDTPKLDDVDDYQTTTQKFYDTVKSSPIATAVGNISAPDTGTAPTLTTPALQVLGGASLDYGIIRDLKSTIDDVLQPTMRAFWCFVAVMIFLMA
ncbi:hypothetical protein M8R19_33020 [Pseudomonas sp. R3.Fl]|uniref:hypothetical protein n=1 Tax=Pseudomonas sp. R3.Fl TaxID=2928708 RepID=UPI00201DC37B|nr:hypothetical protein [Pseudomonas sp. R3.Fl]MCL6687096.1 hypothetical protein [Pseudomonas sp. R3.Fl]MCL6687107.1 hypothetical protein [Pseudomonas sp. R3.Fl]MCL6687118.1 hypothetical protein [Pseudomonas sp. R3.Fl]MCL6693492.1 hypothetical protein [Pseudomonas sp. R3.Fl]MCL6693503.1 hypothetical protein [Pseudomonas sp. R3.Fl]